MQRFRTCGKGTSALSHALDPRKDSKYSWKSGIHQYHHTPRKEIMQIYDTVSWMRLRCDALHTRDDIHLLEIHSTLRLKVRLGFQSMARRWSNFWHASPHMKTLLCKTSSLPHGVVASYTWSAMTQRLLAPVQAPTLKILSYHGFVLRYLGALS